MIWDGSTGPFTIQGMLTSSAAAISGKIKNALLILTYEHENKRGFTTELLDTSLLMSGTFRAENRKSLITSLVP
jgi:hypothetical protein